MRINSSDLFIALGLGLGAVLVSPWLLLGFPAVVLLSAL